MFQEFLTQNNLQKEIDKNSKHFSFILKDCLNYKKEKVLIITDLGTENHRIAPILAGCFQKALKNKAQVIIQEIKSKNQSAEKQVIEALNQLPEKSIIIICLSNMLGKLGILGKSYRKFCRLRKHKFTSTTGMGSLKTEQLNKVINALKPDYTKLRAEGLRIKQLLDKTDEIKVTTKAGTDLTIGVKDMKAMTSIGIYNQPGLGGNMPTGEVFIPIRIRQADGTLVVDVSVRHREGTLLVKKPLIITIKQGKVTSLKGEGAELVEQTLQEAEQRAQFPERVRLVGELGIGLNPDAEILGSTIIDEKVKGTAHVAIGSNYWYGGQIKTIIHLDQVFKDPEIYLDGEKLNL